ncbi:hypothetical protein [Natronorubrum sulfidifaciens]|uniref:Big-1 domain-containing protein n=1 Tax=Natronorubrum sulfidifaciens JCM 14089 TaxID=1230460 RepID=L9VUS4_9EURY|nr:hypothetical protein [Natronorubrum sulfidifaciens]ELY40935.1 hypothetical protein C495_16900 [Natronorubrum sulfidifaciens JCM 14089]
MTFHNGFDARAVSPLIGAILLLAILVALLGLLQLNAVPALTSQTEFEHNQHVQGELKDLTAGLERTATTGTGESVAITPGVRYPSRVVLVNPPPASGTIETASASPITIDGAHANGATGDYWDGDTKSISTRSLVYEPRYNEYDNAPATVVELGALYNRVDDTTIVTEDRGVIDGRTLSLTTVAGEYRHTGVDRTLVDLTPSSAETRTVTVTDREDPITLTLPTDLDESEWESLLESEHDPNGDPDNDRYVTDYSCANETPGPCGELTVTLQSDVTYDLQLAQVGVGHSSVTQTPTYLTDVAGNETSVRAGTQQRLVTEARDELDNPVSGVSVTADVVSGPGTIRATEQRSDTDGRTAFVYDAPETVDGVESVTVEATFEDGAAEQTVTFELRVWGESTGDGSDDLPDESEPDDPSERDGPTIQITNVDDQSNPVFDRYEVTAEMDSTEADLSHVEFELIDSTTGDVLVTVTDSTISGTSATVTQRLERRSESEPSTEYRINAIVYTTDGTSAVDEWIPDST